MRMDLRGSATSGEAHTNTATPTTTPANTSTSATPTPTTTPANTPINTPESRHAARPPLARALSIAVTIAGILYLVALPVLNAQEAQAAGSPATSPATSPGTTSLTDHGLATSAWWVALTAVIVQAVLTLSIRRAPLRTLSAIAATAAVASLAAPSDLAQATLLAVIPAAYIAARHHRTTTTNRTSTTRTTTKTTNPTSLPWWALTAALVWVARTASALPDEDFSTTLAIGAGAAQAVLGLGLPALIGVVLRGRADMHAARERELIARADEQEARAEAALAAERTAIARELHDIAAHHLSGIAIMASAISQQVDTDPDAAKAALKDVRTQTRTLLDELRGLVTLLRSDEGATVAVESLAGVEGLLDSARLRGQDVSLTIAQSADADAGSPTITPTATTPATTTPADARLTRGTPDTLAALTHGIGPLSQFAAYRTIQEALANAARHAPGSRCNIALTSTPRALEIEITNESGASNGSDSPHTHDRPDVAVPAHAGFGLRGMQERAALTKSRLTYGPTDDGGWRVALTVQREESR